MDTYHFELLVCLLLYFFNLYITIQRGRIIVISSLYPINNVHMKNVILRILSLVIKSKITGIFLILFPSSILYRNDFKIGFRFANWF